jgi:protein SCO1
VSSAPGGRLRPALTALSLSAVVLLSGCGDEATAEGGPQAQGHDHSDAPAAVEGPDDAYAGLDLAEPYRRPSFTLTDTTGASFDFKDATSGRPTLLFFGYTNCPDVCPTTLAELRRGLDELDADDAARIDTVMVSIDPARDREIVSDYIDGFVPDAHAVATDDDALLQQVTLAFGVSYQVTTRPNGDVDVAHTDDGLFAVDDTGTLLITWPYGTSGDDIAGDLEQLLADRA